jgi:hypothetical protein
MSAQAKNKVISLGIFLLLLITYLAGMMVL